MVSVFFLLFLLSVNGGTGRLAFRDGYLNGFAAQGEQAPVLHFVQGLRYVDAGIVDERGEVFHADEQFFLAYRTGTA